MNRAGQTTVAAEQEDDAAVIEGSLRDPDRFAAIFDRHGPHIHRYLARRLGRDIADDLVAETFLLAFHKRQRYDLTRGDARPWLYGIATNLVNQHRRDEIRQYRLRQAIGPVADQTSHADQVSGNVAAQSMRQVLSAVLAKLPRGDRDVLLLIAWEDFSYDEVAGALAIPIGTVRSRLNRARKKLRAALDKAGLTAMSEEILRNG